MKDSTPHVDLDQDAGGAGDEEGSAAVLEGLLTEHLADLRAYVRLRSGPRIRELESCSDLVQSVCREVLQSSGQRQFSTDKAFRMWLLRVVENKIIDRLRYHSRHKRDTARTEHGSDLDLLAGPYARIHSPSDDADFREQAQRLEAAFDQLPEDYRTVILQAHIVGMSQRDIALEMDRSVDSVRNLIYRALARLGRILGEQDATS
jgi:RNA polymerase sigma-70 factor (ECF subfamily)